MKKLKILGINISNLSRVEILGLIKNYLVDGKQHLLATPNSEIILNAIKDEELFFIINQADLAIADNIGLKLAGWLMGENLVRFAGADLTAEIIKLAVEKNIKLAVFNRQDGLSTGIDIANALKKIYPAIQIKVVDLPQNQIKTDLTEVNEFSPEIIFSTLGSPYQEKFLYHNLSKIQSAKLAVGVGGAFDFLTGKLPRAPWGLRIIGLEWLWRLYQQPWRWRRIIRAVVVFPVKFLFWKFVLPWFYRKNVACLLYRNTATEPEIFIAERSDEPGHWQLPQGGLDGEDAAVAGQRELREEIGNKKFKLVASFNNLWQYEFDKSTDNNRTTRHSGHKGQRQNLIIAEYFGQDEEIKINFWDFVSWQWIPASKFLQITAKRRRNGYKIFLQKFNQLINNQSD